MKDSELCFLVQTVQVPTAEQYQSLVTALYEKDVVELCYLFGQGLDLTWFPDSGHISTLVALAMFRDNDNGAYAYQATKDLRFPQPGVSLTYLLLKLLPPKEQPTTMLALAVELGNHCHIGREPSAVAVLHRHRDNVQLLLHARADPWQAVPISDLCDHSWNWFGLLSTGMRQCSASFRGTGPKGYGCCLTHSEQRPYRPLETRVPPESTILPHCHVRARYPYIR